MKKLATKKELCTACGACEHICSKAYFKEENKEKSAIRVEAAQGGKPGIIVCTQCGECIDICPVEAIYRDAKGVVRIKQSICVGCFACVGFCPQAAMFQYNDGTEPFKCIACGNCPKECPTGAIFIEE